MNSGEERSEWPSVRWHLPKGVDVLTTLATRSAFMLGEAYIGWLGRGLYGGFFKLPVQ
ncbi:hypothetical protein BQ8794_320106 [Mesorhizobium prunaredense]|uniref:Uncharacterized protein n=1 Tax=Mesorhizobium prunaredense TaxID=1631249 RepID=A0A1R3VDF7_9HYPH|nr:hypothetical protein BQ8794_320106 [Mesorhizobium prunaredense]